MEKHKRVVADVLESFKAPALRLAVGAVMELKRVIIVDRAPAESEKIRPVRITLARQNFNVFINYW